MSRVTLNLKVHLDNDNTGRGYSHWNSTSRRKEFEVLVRQAWRELGCPTVRTPCALHLTRVLGPRQSLYDYDSLLRGAAKELIDAIVAVGIIPDDGPKHVTAVTADQDASRRESGPATVVTISSLEEVDHAE